MAKRIAFGPFLLDTSRGTLVRDGVPLPIGRRAMLVLRALLESPGEVVGKEALIDFAWPGLVVEDSNLSVQIAALRRLLGENPGGGTWIVTVPRAGYRITAEVAAEEISLDPAAAVPATEADRRASIAVLPLVNLGDDASQEWFVDGVTEDVISALARFRWFTVASRNSSFVYKARSVDARVAAGELAVRYLVEGSVRRSGETALVSVQLVDASAGSCLWAERYEFDVADALAVQEQIAQQVAGSIESEVLKREGDRAVTRHLSGGATARDLVAQGSWHFHHVTQPAHLRARELFRQACRLDPESGEARLWLGRVSAGLVAYGWSEQPDDDLREGLQSALQAVQLDERNPYAHYALAITSAYSDSFGLAIPAAAKSVELSPGFALGHLVLGMARLFAGDPESAALSLERGLQLNRYDPQNFIWYHALALAFLFAGRPHEALQRVSAALQIRPAWRPSLRTALACCRVLQRDDDAWRMIERMRGLPEVAGDALQPLWRRNPQWAESMGLWARSGPD
jgi:TolB-like protein